MTIIGLTALNRVVSPCFVYNNVVSGILAFVILAPISHCIKHRLDDQKLWIDRIFAENPSMNSVYPDDSRYVLEPFY